MAAGRIRKIQVEGAERPVHILRFVVGVIGEKDSTAETEGTCHMVQAWLLTRGVSGQKMTVKGWALDVVIYGGW